MFLCVSFLLVLDVWKDLVVVSCSLQNSLSEERVVDEMKVVVVFNLVFLTLSISIDAISKELFSAFERTQVKEGNAQFYIWQSKIIVAVAPCRFDAADILDDLETMFVKQKDSKYSQ